MALTFDHKKQILTYLSSRENWVFHDDSAEEGLHSGRFFNRLRFDPGAFEDMSYYNLANSVKLIIARDLGVESALKAKTHNPSPTSISNIFINFAEELDSTAFDGHEVDIPRRFAIEFKGKDGFDLATEGGYKDWITTQAAVIKEAYDNAENTTPISARASLTALFKAKGTDVNCHGEDWVYMIAKAGGAEALKDKLRKAAKDTGLEKRDFMAMLIEPHKLVVAARKQALQP